MSKFQLDEIAIVIWTTDGDGIGEEVIIKSVLTCSHKIGNTDAPTYKVSFADGDVAYMQPHHLRKKHAPDQDIAETRQAQVDSWDTMMKKLNQEKVV